MKRYLHSRFRHSNSYHIKYSQNFIKLQKVASDIVRLFDLNSNDLIIEIGPGKGALTEFMSNYNVIAIEKDHKLFDELKVKFKDNKNIQMVNEDFLDFELPNNNYKVIGNIPFAITADIFRKLLDSINPPSIIHLIVQKEAALRLIGEPESLFSLIYKPWFVSSVIEELNRTDFYPTPSVDIVVMEIRKRDPPLISLELRDEYIKFISYCFTSWQLDIRHSLKKIFTYKQIFVIAKKLRINLNKKPSELTINEWIVLFNSYLYYVSKDKKSLI